MLGWALLGFTESAVAWLNNFYFEEQGLTLFMVFYFILFVSWEVVNAAGAESWQPYHFYVGRSRSKVS